MCEKKRKNAKSFRKKYISLKKIILFQKELFYYCSLLNKEYMLDCSCLNSASYELHLLRVLKLAIWFAFFSCFQFFFVKNEEFAARFFMKKEKTELDLS